MTKKEFALQAIGPYYKDRNLCGYENGGCKYITSYGKKCVFGKYTKDPIMLNGNGSALAVLKMYNEIDILVPEAVGILTKNEWQQLQEMHDTIAQSYTTIDLREEINNLNLFTLQELEEYCENN